MKKLLIRLFAVAVICGGGWYAYHFFSNLPSRKVQTPTTKVRRGDVVVRSFTRGELRAVRSAPLTAPNLFGTVQVTRLAPLGGFAKEKDLIVEFDDSEVLSRLESKQLELEQIDEQIKKAQADLAIRNNQDQVDLLRARYSVRRSELEVKRNELLPTIDQKKNVLNLEEARRRLKQLESDIKSKQEQAQAELNVLRERRNRSLLDISREKSRLAQVKLLSPISGLVAIKQNRGGFSGMFGSQVPDIREGDQVQPGTPVAEVLDLSELEVVARVGELDRANLREDQEVLIRLDAISGKVFNGKIKSMSGTASANLFSADPGKKFDVVFSIDMRQLLTALGAKPEQVARILATAEENRKKPIAAPSTSLFAGMPGGFDPAAMGGGAPGGGAPMMFQMGGGQGGPGGQGAQGGQGGGMRMMLGGGQGMSEDQQRQLREALQKATGGRDITTLSQEERQAVFAKLREQMGGAGGAARKGDDSKKGGEGQQGEGARGERRRPEGQAAEGGERRRPEGQPGEGGEGGERRQRRDAMAMGGPGGPGMMMGGFGGSQGFSQKDMDNAELPAPPGEDSQFDVLLRPGLLADVEIIVEKVPNAIFVPNQSIFEKEGKLVVFVKAGERFEQRPIQIAKRSESVSIISSGLQEGDVISMNDPTVQPGEKKADKKGGGGGGGAMGAMPSGGATKGGGQ